jgi:Spy/CpxP family protein refolding chaperone
VPPLLELTHPAKHRKAKPSEVIVKAAQRMVLTSGQPDNQRVRNKRAKRESRRSREVQETCGRR